MNISVLLIASGNNISFMENYLVIVYCFFFIVEYNWSRIFKKITRARLY